MIVLDRKIDVAFRIHHAGEMIVQVCGLRRPVERIHERPRPAGLMTQAECLWRWQMKIDRRQPEELRRIWRAIQKDKVGAGALTILKEYGFDLDKIGVEPCTWPGIIASIPVLPSQRARSRLLRPPAALRSASGFLLELARGLTSPYSHVEARDPRAGVIYTEGSDELDPRNFLKAAEFLEKVLSRKWVITEHNPLQNAIASLRWEIKWRTKKPHDKEIVDLLDAAFRAAGFKKGFQMQFESLKKAEKFERETRKAGRRKLMLRSPR